MRLRTNCKAGEAPPAGSKLSLSPFDFPGREGLAQQEKEI